MDRQGERVAHADVPHPARTDRGVDHRHPKRATRVMGRAAPDPGHPGWHQDVRCRLDRDAPRSQPAAERPRTRPRRGLLACRRARPLRGACVVFLHALRRALPARAHRDPGGTPRATVGGAAGARVESAPVTTPKSGGRLIATVLVLISLPVVLALIEAVSFYVSNRSNGSFVSSGREREYLLYVPRSYDRSKPTALVISLHGVGCGVRHKRRRASGTAWRTSTASSSCTPREKAEAGQGSGTKATEPNRPVMSDSSPS